MPSSTSLRPTDWPARAVLMLIFFLIEAEPAATGDHGDTVVEGVVRLRDGVVGPRGRGVDLGGAFHGEGLMRALAVEGIDEPVEAGLLLQDVGAGGASGLLLEGEAHALVTAVLLGVAGLNAFDGDAEAEPPDGELGAVE
jgi:hypothetical protein